MTAKSGLRGPSECAGGVPQSPKVPPARSGRADGAGAHGNRRFRRVPTITTGAAPPRAAKGSPGAGVNMPRRPKAAQGGFDSRPVADAATSGDRRTICMSTGPSPRHRVRGVSLRATRRCAPTQHRNRAQIQLRDAARPAPEGAKEKS